MITVLSGGVGAARLLRGMIDVIDPSEIVAIVNTGDDLALHGLYICPDIDTVRSALADTVEEPADRGLESWRVMDELEVLAGQAPSGSRAGRWFPLDDRALAVHLYRTQRLTEGASLTQVSTELARAAKVGVRILPMSDQPVSTLLRLESGDEIDVQEYAVAHAHDVTVTDVRFAGIGEANPAAGVIDAIERAERVIIAPSNPLVSIGPVLALPGVAEAVRRRRRSVVAISPIIDGKALKGPAGRMLTELGQESSVVGVARLWSPFAATLVVDLADETSVAEVEAQGMRCVTTSTVMTSVEDASALADDVLHLALP